MLTENQVAFEIGLWGSNKARSFLHNLLQRFGGNASAAARAIGNEPPIHEMTPEEDEASDKRAIKEWNQPEEDSLHERAVKFILRHDGCLSSQLKQAMVKEGATKGTYQYTLAKLADDPRVRKEGQRGAMRWFKA